MKNKIRKFSVPFTGENADKFIDNLKKYQDSVENVYLGIGRVGSNHGMWDALLVETNDFEPVERMRRAKNFLKEYDDNCFDFLTKSEGLTKRIIALNAGFFQLTYPEIEDFVLDIVGDLVEKYNIDGLILTDYTMACFAHKKFPHLELHTSCNCFQWTLRTMDIWKKFAGISVFNPPREILRSPEKLKEMHDAGFKLKCIVNEGCLYGCPQTINHCMYLADQNFGCKIECDRGDLSNVFKGNWVLPRWLDKLDEYVDIYKLSGRYNGTDYVFSALDAYIKGSDNVNIFDLIIGGPSNYVKDKFLHAKMTAKEIPDRLLTCECNDCRNGCTVCGDLYKRLCSSMG